MNDHACILIWDAHTRMGHNIVPYAYGISHTRMGRPIRVWDNIRIWGRTELKVSLLLNVSLRIRPLTIINEALRLSGSPFVASTASP